MNKKGLINRLVTFISILLFSSQASAYIDPGSGSLILQGLIAGVAMGMYTLKLYWYKIKSFFSFRKKEENIEEED